MPKLTLQLKAGKTISPSILVERLKSLHEELTSMQQESSNKEDLELLVNELVQPQLIQSKDKGVKVITACCIANVLRIYAPEPPFSAEDLGSIFKFFTAELRGIADIHGAYFSFYFYLLESLATVRTIVLALDIPKSDELIFKLFKNFLADMRVEHSKEVKMCFVEILHQLIEESEIVTFELIELLLSTAEKEKKDSAAHLLALDTLKLCADKVQPQVCQYFTELLAPVDKWEDSIHSQFKRQHEFIAYLGSNSLDLLINVFPIIEEEINSENVDLRMLAVKCLGEIIHSCPLFYRRSKMIFDVWCQRRLDKILSVRLLWLEYAIKLLNSSHDLSVIESVNEMISERLQDHEEKVRLFIVKQLCGLSFCHLKLINSKCLETIKSRLMDIKESVRIETLKLLCKLYKEAFGEGSSNILYETIPNALFSILFTQDVSCRTTYFLRLDEFLFSPLCDDEQRADRLEHVWSCLDDNGVLAFTAFLRNKYGLVKFTDAFLNLLLSGGEESKLRKILEVVFQKIDEKGLSFEETVKFIKDNPIISSCLKTLLSLSSSMEQRLESIDSLKTSTQSTKHAAFFHSFAIRIGWNILDQSVVKIILEKNKNHSRTRLVNLILAEIPSLLSNQLDTMVDAVLANPLEEENVISLYRYLKKTESKTAISTTKLSKLSETLNALSFHSSLKNSVYCCKLLSLLDDSCVMANVQKMIERLEVKCNLNDLAILSVLALKAPLIISTHSKFILSFCKDLLLKQEQEDLENLNLIEEVKKEWSDLLLLPAPIAKKILALKTIVNFTRGKLMENTISTEQFSSLYHFLIRIIENHGCITDSPQEESSVGKKVLEAQLRLHSGLGVLQFSKFTLAADLVKIDDVFLLAQDESFAVREGFYSKLYKYLLSASIPKPFISIFFLAAFEPSKGLKSKIAVFTDTLRRNNQKEAFYVEKQIFQIFKLLAIHPDFGVDAEEIAMFKNYVDFYLDRIMDVENCSFLFECCNQMKRYSIVPELATKNFYILAEIGMHSIRAKCQLHHWPISTMPPCLKIPTFMTILPPAVQTQNLTTNFLPLPASGSSEEGLKKKKVQKAIKAVDTTSPARKNAPRIAKTIAEEKRKSPNSSFSFDAEDDENISVNKKVAIQ